MTPSAATKAALDLLFKRALFIRLGLAVFLHFFTSDYTFAPDQETYHAWSEQLSQYWTGDTLLYPGRLRLAGEPIGYYHIVAVLYLVFGPWSLLPKLLNAVVGAITVLLSFDLTLRITGEEEPSLRAAKYVAYFPSLVLWSTMNIRDCWVVLLIVLICRQALKMQDRPTAGGLLLLGLAVYVLTTFRAYILWAVTLPILVSFLVRERKHLLRNTAMGMLVAGAIIYADASAGRERRMRFIDFEELDRSRRWSSSAAQSGFAQDVDISTPGRALAFLPIGLAYFLLAPFPWAIGSFRQAFALPEMLFFYTLIPALIRGTFVLLRRHTGGAMMIVLVTASITFGYAVGQGNVGTIYRHRAQVLPCLLLIAAVGVESTRRRQTQPAPALRQAQPVRLVS